MSSTSTRSFIKAILLTGIGAGILDLTLGVVGYYVLLNGFLPDSVTTLFKNVLQYIARGAFGDFNSYSTTTLEIAGVFFHFFIAISFTWFFFLIYPSLRFLHKNVLVTAVLYGIFVWAVMNMLVVPLAFHTPHIPSDWRRAAYQALVLIVCIGLPITIGAKSHFHK